MLKIPSTPADAGRYRIAWSRDPAFKPLALPSPPADDAPEAEVKAYEAALDAIVLERANAIRVARETQDWSALTIDGERPTLFVMRWLPVAVRARWNDALRRAGGPMGVSEALAELFLLALEGMENPNRKLVLAESERFGTKMAPESVLDDLARAVGRARVQAMISDLAGQVFEQEESTGPL